MVITAHWFSCWVFTLLKHIHSRKMSDTDDLERTLMLAAAAADSRENEAQNSDDFEDVKESQERDTFEETNQYKDTLASKTSRDDSDEHKDNVKSVNTSSPSKRERESPKGGQKHKIDDDDDEEPPHKRPTDYYTHSKVVATHYNSIDEKGLAERSKSRIVYMRNFHNFIKSMLINEYLTQIKETKNSRIVRVHDMCCGKGGDLLKWKKGNITHLICSDIAEVSLDHCKQRFSDMKQRSARERGGGNIFSIEYISGDATRVRLREKYADASLKLDLVSCQFAFHYSFESLPQAECMMRNAGECLAPGGFFIGTIPDSNEIVARARKTRKDTFGNNVFTVSLDFDVNKTPPLFGAKYNFYLDGVVNCPEFLVHFPTFIELAKKFGLKLVKKEKFYEYFERIKSEGRQLLSTMKGLEPYPPHEAAVLVGTENDDYLHAEEFLKNLQNKDNNAKVGTLSKSEWEASSVYTTLVFQKVKNTWNADGTACYDI